MKKCWLQFLRAREGMALVEYALLAALLALAAISGVVTLGAKINTHFMYISNALS